MDIRIFSILLTEALKFPSLRPGIPGLLDLSPLMICRGADVIITEIKCTKSAIHMSHPENHAQPRPEWAEKSSSTKPVLVPKKRLGTAGPRDLPGAFLGGKLGLEPKPSCSPSSIPGGSSKEEMSRAELLKTSQETAGEEESR